ncbi:TPA: tRNA (N(6)-L-threonylcarbamoyladenosine(37)-C(2))-methylthiotransferase MtaB [Candidatus Bipolaricaulota bacterium]|nr:tRNA (N(6)-L-threonylcarbamoyladenosine(37)-C(2))-methylthiotransferase MtaB [Candidatus Bipolaricaulota bacterium]
MARLRVAWRTLGCRANQYDTEMMKARLAGDRTFEIVPNGGAADIYIINTCTVTARAEAKARQYIRRCARRGLVLVTGCWATVAPEEVAAISEVGLIFTNAEKLRIREVVKEALSGRRGIFTFGPALVSDAARAEAEDGLPPELDEERIVHDSAHTRAFVKVQDGCDRFCTFCRTIHARGRPRSKSPQAVLAEVKGLVERGFVEVVLTGIDLAAYGQDNTNGNGVQVSLAELLWRLSELPGLKRLRLSSINPQGITPELVEFFQKSPKGCPYFHIPLQSGDDRILRRMNRGYTADEYREKVELIRDSIPRAMIGADVLVGFPGEGEEHFLRTYHLLEELVPLRLHIFRYSRRPGTAAAHFPEQVPEREKLARARRLRELGVELGRRVREGYLGRRLEVLVEERAGDGLWRGWSENYIDVHLLPSTEKGLRPGEVVEVKIRGVKEEYLLGEVD